METPRVDHVPHENCQFAVFPIFVKPILLVRTENSRVVGEAPILLKAQDEAIFMSS
jgi:hypothetical protein